MLQKDLWAKLHVVVVLLVQLLIDVMPACSADSIVNTFVDTIFPHWKEGRCADETGKSGRK
jgi:hypothetical protein